jgi:formylglycine-generating enzyme required for sulfatase activity
MVYVKKFFLDEVIEGAAHTPHPAFLVGSKELDGIYISKFQNIVVDGLAYSLPDKDPATNITFDEALAACEAKGKGFHLMSAAEWGAIALWCQKNRHLPFGNNDEGKDIREEKQIARPSYVNQERGIFRVATGSGPVEWSHNKNPDGIYDLNANVWEWVSGLRLVYGELQILSNVECSAASDSADWRAIDGKTGELVSGTTSCQMCKRLVINAGISRVIVRESNDEYTIYNVQDWIDNDDSLGQIGY